MGLFPAAPFPILRTYWIETLNKDKTFRRYASGVERSLSLFDSTLQGWADYISFLSRLLKTLENHPEGITAIPNKLLVAKRLAQCLQPALPSGVHQKALEVYSFVFALIGKDGLEEDLGVYLPGIASTLTFGSISVRARFLSLIESHVLKLSTDALRPALKSLILALLPGLEEEASDDFEKALLALSRCRKAFQEVGQGEIFWQNLFLSSITSPARRQGVLAYLSRFLPMLHEPGSDQVGNSIAPSTEILELINPEPGLLLRCFITGLADEQVLIQRAFLDLLVSHLPLHAPIFGDVVPVKDLHLLVSAAVGVVLRRDMSLNRRLWSWFLGSDQKGIESIHSPTDENASPAQKDFKTPRGQPYLQRYGVQPLIAALESLVAQKSRSPSQMSRPFRIALSLMDRWEIGNPVVNAIFLPLMKNLQAYRQYAASSEDFDEVFRSANVFFDGVESTLIWSKMLTLLISDGKDDQEAHHDLELASFIMGNFNVAEEEMVNVHIPLVSLAMLEALHGKSFPKAQQLSAQIDIQTYIFDLLEVLIDVASLNGLSIGNETPVAAEDSLKENVSLTNAIKDFYSRSENVLRVSEPPFAPGEIRQHILGITSSMILSQLTESSNGQDLGRTVQLLSVLLHKLSRQTSFDLFRLAQALQKRITSRSEASASFHFTSAAVSLYKELHYWDSQRESLDAIMATILAELTQDLWNRLSFKTPQDHVRALGLLTDLQETSWRDELVTSALLTAISTDLRPKGCGLERFAAFWTHARAALASPEHKALPSNTRSRSNTKDRKLAMQAFSEMVDSALLMVVDILHSPRDNHFIACKNWVQSLPDLSR